MIIRRFPPGYTKDQFNDLVLKWNEFLDYRRFAPGKRPKPLSGMPVIYGRAYLDFKDSTALLSASEALNGRVVADSEGFECALEVSLAPYQGVPTTTTRADPLCGTYETSSHYKAFLESMEAASRPTPIPLDKQFDLMMQQERELNPWKYEKALQKQTPLIQYLKSRPPPSFALGGEESRHAGSAGKKNKQKKKSKKKASSAQDAKIAEPARPMQAPPKPPIASQSTAAPQPKKKATPKPAADFQPKPVPKHTPTLVPKPAPTLASKPVPKQPHQKPVKQSVVDAKPIVNPSTTGAPIRIMSRSAQVNSQPSAQSSAAPAQTQPATRVYTSQSKQQAPRQNNRGAP